MKASNVVQLPGLKVVVASGFWQRLVGLLGRRDLAQDAGLLLVPCNNIHTAFMRFAIDAVFVSDAGTVLAIVPQLRPFRVAVARRAHACLELRSGGAARLGLQVGQQLAPLGLAIKKAK
jgi:uncharacterized membrane protein (UPF0127 family)